MAELSNKYRILKVLYKSQKPLTSREIAQRVNLPHTSIPISLKRLHKFVSSKKEDRLNYYYIPKHLLDFTKNRLNYLIERDGGNINNDENRLDTDTE